MMNAFGLHRPALLAILGLLFSSLASPSHAQQRPPAARAAAPAPGAALETIQIRPNIYVIFGAGANITAQVGEDGVVLVDSGSAARAEQVVAAVRAFTPKPIRLIVNTSADPDHVGG